MCVLGFWAFACGRVFWAFGLVLCCLPLLCGTCPAQCNCFYHKLSDGSKSRSVLCNDPDLTIIPNNFPSDTSKLRIEKTAISRVASESFHYLSSLEYLWISFNSLSSLSVDGFRGLYALDELRIDGNVLTSFPWECLMDMPNLRLLDLHNNKISSIPAEATIYIKNLTYLDLSSNSLATVPAEVLTSWFSPKPPQDIENSKMILGLHDNPWQCDCRLFDLVQFQKYPSSSVAFIDTGLRCAEPESLSGVLFSDTELRKCQVPRVHTAVARVRSSIGNNVLLRCGTIGVPIPELSWYRADGKPMNGTVQQEVSKEGIIWSILSVPAVSYRDSGKYVCRATNFVGSADAIISLVISDTWQIDEAVAKRSHGKKNGGFGRAAYQEKLIARYVPPATSAAVPIIEPLNRPKVTSSIQIESYSISDNVSKAKTTAPPPAATETDSGIGELQKDVLSNLEANASSLQQGPERRVVRSVKVIGDTDHTVSLNWRAPTATNTTSFSVLYAVFGERDMRRINVGPGQNRVTIEGLVPKTKYIACVCVKGLIPKKEQCVIFSTDEAASASGTQKLINVVVITVACVIAVPLTLIVCCGALKRRLQKLMGRKSKDMQDSYVTFETLSPGTKAKGLEGEYLTRLNPDESNRLLSARSSVDSEATARTEGQPNEYFC
ncbi:leucine-rich repeat, immunoglobulin-like domain and transmembrane domain-containing protein 1b [Garra rufa]|uniref:leucine-rich repeat, immunoglobulin-like domain and transmembrane domain-containing protein 1b n=1 Tax=Garra rufa TaxID=137080 RepID=UPI003CCEA2BD